MGPCLAKKKAIDSRPVERGKTTYGVDNRPI